MFLTLSQTRNFRLLEFAGNGFKFYVNGRKFFKRVEKTVGKGEIAGFEEFLLLPQRFQKTCRADRKNQGLFWKGLRASSNGLFDK